MYVLKDSSKSLNKYLGTLRTHYIASCEKCGWSKKIPATSVPNYRSYNCPKCQSKYAKKREKAYKIAIPTMKLQQDLYDLNIGSNLGVYEIISNPIYNKNERPVNALVELKCLNCGEVITKRWNVLLNKRKNKKVYSFHSACKYPKKH